MSQEEFSDAYCIPLDDLKAWERRQREPSQAEAHLIELIARDPEHTKRVQA